MAKKDEMNYQAEDMEPTSSITYAADVVSTIAGIAAAEVDGIARMCPVGSASLLKSSASANSAKGVRVEVGTEEASVDLYVIVEYGTPIQKAAQDAQENVRKAIESMTGLHVVKVDVHVQGVSFEQEKKNLEAGKQPEAIEEEKPVEAVRQPEEPVKEEEPAKVELVEEEIPVE